MKKWITVLCVCVFLATIPFAANDKNSSTDTGNNNLNKTPGNVWLHIPGAEETYFFVSAGSNSSSSKTEQILEAEAAAGSRVFYRGGPGNGYVSSE